MLTDPYRRFHLSLCEHTGAVVFWQHRSYTFTGTLERCEAAYRTAQLHNLGAGWWSVVSLLVMNWVALISNWSAVRGVRELAKQPPAAGYVPAAARRRVGTATRRAPRTATGTGSGGRRGPIHPVFPRKDADRPLHAVFINGGSVFHLMYL